MTNAFQLAMKFVLDHETSVKNPTGYVNDPVDPGGETKYGIAKRFHPNVDIKNLSLADAMVIYERDYWTPHKLDDKPLGMGVVLFDSYVQHKPTVVDTMYKQSGDDVRAFLEARRHYYLFIIEKNPSQVKYKNGWMNRCNDLAKYVDIVTINV